MEEYPSNARPKEEAKVEKRVTKPVTTGSARTKKKGELAKFADIFIAKDVADVKTYIFMDVLVPSIKKAIYDIVTNGLDMLLYNGEAHTRKSGNASKVSYDKRYVREDDRRREPDRNRVRSGLDYDDIEFESRGDAEAVLSGMEDVIEQYGQVSVGDLYDLANVSTTNYAINKYGWNDLRSAYVQRTRHGMYVLKLPRAIPLG